MKRLLYFAIALLQVLLGALLAFRIIPPNDFVGWKIGTNLNDEAKWYFLNAVFGWGLFLTGIMAIILFKYLNQKNIPEGRKEALSLAILVAGLLISAACVKFFLL